MSDTILSLIAEAAAHPLLGHSSSSPAFVSGTATGGSTTKLTCSTLADGSGATTFADWWLYVTASTSSPTLAGQSRRVESVDLSVGDLTINSQRPYGRAPDTNDQFVLTRRFSRDGWLDLANASLREMTRRVVLTTPGLGPNVKRYSPPAGIVRPEEVLDIGARATPEVNTDGQPVPLRWWGWEDDDGTLTLLTDRDYGTGEELVFDVLRPYATAGQNALSSDTDTTSAPRDWLVAEMVARALLAIWAAAPDADKPKDTATLRAAGGLVAGLRRKYGVAQQRRVPGIGEAGF